MSHTVTPSKQKFRIAKLFTRGLQQIYGQRLVAVFVTGSVAANLAVPESDIDIIPIIDIDNLKQREELLKKAQDWATHFGDKRGEEIVVSDIDKKSFELFGKNIVSLPMRFDYKFHHQSLLDGSVPIFGSRKYLETLKGFAFNLPIN